MSCRRLRFDLQKRWGVKVPFDIWISLFSECMHDMRALRCAYFIMNPGGSKKDKILPLYWADKVKERRVLSLSIF